MADLTQTPANVGIKSSSPTNIDAQHQYGEAMTAGQPCYLKSADNKLYKADATDAEKDEAFGITLTDGSTDDYGVVAKPGASVDLGATLTVGEAYVVSGSGTAGKISPIGDLGTGDYVFILGVASAADTLPLKFINSGVAKP